MPHRYLPRCADGSYYVGSTRNLERRLAEHAAGVVESYTKSRRPVDLVYIEEYDRIDDAYFRGKQIQGWRRRKREALITGEFDRLPPLSSRAWRNRRA